MKSDLNQALQGKNTLEASQILAEAFFRRFGGKWGEVTEIQKSLVPRGKAVSWSGLDRNINLFCKQFYATWETDADKLGFWDEVRFLLHDLPMIALCRHQIADLRQEIAALKAEKAAWDRDFPPLQRAFSGLELYQSEGKNYLLLPEGRTARKAGTVDKRDALEIVRK